RSNYAGEVIVGGSVLCQESNCEDYKKKRKTGLTALIHTG
ncbi:10004_t:CDS:1, partial [Racocetra persica]